VFEHFASKSHLHHPTGTLPHVFSITMTKSSATSGTFPHQDHSPVSRHRQQQSSQEHPRQGGPRHQVIPTELLPRSSRPTVQRIVATAADRQAFMLDLIDQALALFDNDLEDETHPQGGAGGERESGAGNEV
jgi:hypothetical protein